MCRQILWTKKPVYPSLAVGLLAALASWSILGPAHEIELYCDLVKKDIPGGHVTPDGKLRAETKWEPVVRNAWLARILRIFRPVFDRRWVSVQEIESGKEVMRLDGAVLCFFVDSATVAVSYDDPMLAYLYPIPGRTPVGEIVAYTLLAAGVTWLLACFLIWCAQKGRRSRRASRTSPGLIEGGATSPSTATQTLAESKARSAF